MAGPSSSGATNGVNGTTNGHHEIEVTKLFSHFVLSTTYTLLSPEVISKLKELLIDFIGVASGGAESSESSPAILKAVLSLGAANGSNTVIAKGHNFTAPFAALLNGAFGHSFDFDDTHLEGVLHPGVSVIPAALAEAETRKASGEDMLTALAIGYEVSCRLSVQLRDMAYARGFHNTATAGIFGAVAAISSLRKLPTDVIENAFGLAGSKASGSMQYLENGAWNKRLHPGFAAHDAFTCVALAEAGVVGASKIIEGKFGYLHAYTTNENVSYSDLVLGLGGKWAFMATALKPYPGCRMTHTAIEIAGDLKDKKGLKASEIERIKIAIKPSCYAIVGVDVRNKRRPDNVVDAQFSIYFQTAVALLDGSNTGWKVYDRIQNKDVNELCDKVDVVKDAGYKGMETKIVIKMKKDGEEVEEELIAPLGEDENPFVKEKVLQKYMSLAGPVFGEKRAVKVQELVDSLEKNSAAELTALLA